MSDGSDWTTHDSRTTHNGHNFEVRSETVTIPTGAQREFEYVHVDDAAVILAFTPNGDVLLVSEWRQQIKQHVQHGLPGGAVEDGESPAEAANRELREETGYEAGTLDLMFESAPHAGVTSGTQWFYLAQDCERVGEPDNPDDAENTSVNRTAFCDLLDAIEAGEVLDARTIQPVLYYDRFYHSQD